MPRYEYICQTCGERFEKLIRGDASTQQILPVARAAIKRALDLRDQRQQRTHLRLAGRLAEASPTQPCVALIQPEGHDERRVSG
jgi:hypothetical protein